MQVLDVLGIEMPWKADGASLRRPLSEERPRKQMMSGKPGSGWVRHLTSAQLDLGPQLQRKLALFGSGSSNPYRVPRPPKFGALVGRKVTECRVERGAERVRVDSLASFLDFRPTPEAVPFDVAGRFTGQASGTVRYVALAVNGTVRTVTRTWQTMPDRWLATPPLDAWQIGRNEVDVFLVTGDDAHPVLRQLRVEAARAVSSGNDEAEDGE
jgi:hypothetical protein